MKQLILLAVFLPALAAGAKTSFCLSPSDLDLFNQVSRKLNEIKSVRYDYKRELHYASEDIHHEMSGNCFLDFTQEDEVLGLRYQVVSPDYMGIYNGSEKVDFNPKLKKMKVSSDVKRQDFAGFSFFYNSLITFRSILPKLTGDPAIEKSVSDTLLGNTRYNLLKISLDQQSIGYLGNLRKITSVRKVIYRLIIDKKSFLPLQILESNNVNSDFTRVSFSQMFENPPAPAESSWFYSSYSNKYALENGAEAGSALIAAGKEAPEWKLPVFDTSDSISLQQLEGKVVLVEFWIKNCGYCIAAIPKLNEINSHYRGKDFRLLAVNSHDPKDVIASFKNKMKLKPEYDLLYAGEKITKDYGVWAYPTVVLIDKNKKVIYSGAFDHAKLAQLIDENL
ncbi:Thiol-disulfide oxidoreductase ResA [Dyadobacter sp. CECT 9275]|uniref:Thiol-disulfide oxidoreductase ResA n=1 Tax=Dyadobacter helix TaxID=2822344 RepID=A0A916NJR4_9BACT|nr:TlpA disulfide reductase family protein [Dyadobacter sp. CECT 9275]CAG4990635.1 Thiol-disulfide oxidoreductase ResA [Dyadobacter sp. CECT 9275]